MYCNCNIWFVIWLILMILFLAEAAATFVLLDVDYYRYVKRDYVPSLYLLALILKRKPLKDKYQKEVGKYIYYESNVFKIVQYCEGVCEYCFLSRHNKHNNHVKRLYGGWIAKASTHDEVCIDPTDQESYQLIRDKQKAKELARFLRSL